MLIVPFMQYTSCVPEITARLHTTAFGNGNARQEMYINSASLATTILLRVSFILNKQIVVIDSMSYPLEVKLLELPCPPHMLP